MARVEFHAGELFPRLGFIVTNLETPSRAVVWFYSVELRHLLAFVRRGVMLPVAAG